MNESKISVRYAKALFNLAAEKQILDIVKNDMELISESCKIKEFNDFLNSPIIPVSKKEIIFEGIFKGNVHQVVLDTLLLIAKNRRETFLNIISLNFLTLYRKYFGITEAQLTTAFEIPEDTKQKLIELLRQIVDGKIELKQNLNPEIIGGFILRIDDKQLDSSVKTQLKNFRKQLTNKILL